MDSTPPRRSSRLASRGLTTPPRRIQTPTEPPPVVRQVRRAFDEEDAAHALLEMSYLESRGDDEAARRVLEAAVESFRKYLVARRQNQSERIKINLFKELLHNEAAYVNM